MKFNWRKFVLIVARNETNRRIEKALRKLTAPYKLTIRQTYRLNSSYSRMTDQLRRVVEESCDKTRIYILLAGTLVAIDLTRYLHQIRPKVFRQYAVVSLDYDIVYASTDKQNEFNSLIDRGEGEFSIYKSIYNALAIITPSPATSPNFDEFCERVANRTQSLEGAGRPRHNVLAALAYDSVRIYANALASKENSTSGHRLIRHILNRTYSSALGFDVRLDSNGNAEGHYVVLTLDNNASLVNKSRWQNQPFFANFEQVGIFLANEKSELPHVDFLKGTWVTNRRQLKDEPDCGFHNEKCQKLRLLLVAFIVLFLILLIVGLCFLVKFLILHAELEAKHWKIDLNSVTILAIDKNQDSHDVVKMIKVSLTQTF